MNIYRVQARVEGVLRHSRFYRQEWSAKARAERYDELGYEVAIDVAYNVVFEPYGGAEL